MIDVGVTKPVDTLGTFGDYFDTDRFPQIAPEVLMNTFPCGEASDVFGLAYLIQKVGLTKTQSLPWVPSSPWCVKLAVRNPLDGPTWHH